MLPGSGAGSSRDRADNEPPWVSSCGSRACIWNPAGASLPAAPSIQASCLFQLMPTTQEPLLQLMAKEGVPGQVQQGLDQPPSDPCPHQTLRLLPHSPHMFFWAEELLQRPQGSAVIDVGLCHLHHLGKRQTHYPEEDKKVQRVIWSCPHSCFWEEKLHYSPDSLSKINNYFAAVTLRCFVFLAPICVSGCSRS